MVKFKVLQYRVLYVNGDEYIEGTVTIDRIIFQNYFVPCYSSTVHKYQGGKIDKKYAKIRHSSTMV